jgi:hypothetical protein
MDDAVIGATNNNRISSLVSNQPAACCFGTVEPAA